jgi:hypothetical protein
LSLLIETFTLSLAGLNQLQTIVTSPKKEAPDAAKLGSSEKVPEFHQAVAQIYNKMSSERSPDHHETVMDKMTQDSDPQRRANLKEIYSNEETPVKEKQWMTDIHGNDEGEYVREFDTEAANLLRSITSNPSSEAVSPNTITSPVSALDTVQYSTPAKTQISPKYHSSVDESFTSTIPFSKPEDIEKPSSEVTSGWQSISIEDSSESGKALDPPKIVTEEIQIEGDNQEERVASTKPESLLEFEESKISSSPEKSKKLKNKNKPN